MTRAEILYHYNSLYDQEVDSAFFRLLEKNFSKPQSSNIRLGSISVEDAFFGDSGKGAVVAKLNAILGANHSLVSLRYNGGANAGHETYVNGQKIVTSQLPMGVIQEGAIAIISRGMVVHPRDLAFEIEKVTGYFGHLPGMLFIDERTPLSLDTHRAIEAVFKGNTTGSSGSTNRGISPSYASIYQRNQVTLKDLLSDDWEDTLKNHYRFYEKQVEGFGVPLKEIQVVDTYHPKETIPVGSEEDFLGDLSFCRNYLDKFSSRAIYHILKTAWKDPRVCFTFEGAQGAGLDPYHGVSPDYTASRPMSRFINDATYNIILPEEIALRLAVTKTTYISSVGSRQLPTIHDEKWEKWVQKEFGETGRITERLRAIYLLSIPIANFLKRAAGYHYLVATHLDSGKNNTPIRVVTHYTDKITGRESGYLPFQDELNKLNAHALELPGYDGEATKLAQSFEELPENAKRYLLFLSQTVAPTIFLTHGADLKDYISLLPKSLL